MIKWALRGDHPLWAAADEEAAECRQQEAVFEAPVVAPALPTATATSTPAPTTTPSPADVRITDLTLSDEMWVSDFSSLQEPVVLRANGLWVQVTNVGGMPYVAPSGGGQYTLQVMLNKAGEQLDGYAYAPGHPDELEALPDLQPGASYVLRVDGLFFWTPVTDAQLYVLIKPEPDLNFRDSILAKSVSVQPNPDSDCACVAGVARNVARSWRPGMRHRPWIRQDWAPPWRSKVVDIPRRSSGDRQMARRPKHRPGYRAVGDRGFRAGLWSGLGCCRRGAAARSYPACPSWIG